MGVDRIVQTVKWLKVNTDKGFRGFCAGAIIKAARGIVFCAGLRKY
jgi:hypothetical protein